MLPGTWSFNCKRKPDWTIRKFKARYCVRGDGDFDSNVDTDDILSLLAEWDAEYFMDTPSTFHMRESYALKNQIQDPETPTYMEALSGRNIAHVRRSEGKRGYYTAVISLG